MTKPRFSFLAILFVLAAPAIGFLNTALYHPDAKGDVITGRWQVSFEKSFDKALPIRDFALDVWGVIQFSLTGEGRSGVVVGRDGWLFTSEDFAYTPDYALERERKVRLMVATHEQLAKQGIDLQLFIVPDKSRVLSQHLGLTERPPHTQSRYADIRAKLATKGISTPDLLAALQQQEGGDHLFLRTDTHWTPAGALLAAQAIAQNIPAEATWRQDLDFVTTLSPEMEHRGDLLNFLRLGPFYGFFGIAPDHLAVPVTRLSDMSSNTSGASLLDDEEIPCTYIGTSNGANPKWNFVGALKQVLRTDITNAAQEGRGPFVPMAEYLAGDAFTQTPPQCILWEIPERQIDVIYDLSAHYFDLPWLKEALSYEP
jgi:alginate O-acetyltransferase complex protein AlgJ